MAKVEFFRYGEHKPLSSQKQVVETADSVRDHIVFMARLGYAACRMRGGINNVSEMAIAAKRHYAKRLMEFGNDKY